MIDLLPLCMICISSLGHKPNDRNNIVFYPFRCLIEPPEEAHRNRVFLTYAGQVCKHVSSWISDLWITAGSPAALKAIPPDPVSRTPAGEKDGSTALVPKFSSLEAAKQGFIAAAKAKTPILSKLASSVLSNQSSGKLTSQPARLVSSAPTSAYTSPAFSHSPLGTTNKSATPGQMQFAPLSPGPRPRFQSLQEAKDGFLAAAKASLSPPGSIPPHPGARPRFQSLQEAKEGFLAAAKASIPSPGKFGPQLPPPKPLH